MLDTLPQLKTLMAGQIFLDASDGETITVPREGLLFSADFTRDGSDLVLVNTGRPSVRISGYFDHDDPPAIGDPTGGQLSGAVVERLAGPEPLLVAQAGGLAGGSAARLIGQVETLAGSVTVQRASGAVEEMGPATKVFANDVVRTGPGASLSITFADGTIFTMAANSRMVLDSMVYDPQASDGNSSTFNLVEGSFVFIAGQVAKTGNMQVNTPTATMGIRGTTVAVEIVTVNGITTVEVALDRDPDGTLGTFTLRRLDGTVIDTLETTATKWIVSPVDGETREVPRTLDDLASDQVLLTQASAAFTRAQQRFQQEGRYVEGADGQIEDRRGDLGSGLGTDFADNGFLDGPDAGPEGSEGELFAFTGGTPGEGEPPAPEGSAIEPLLPPAQETDFAEIVPPADEPPFPPAAPPEPFTFAAPDADFAVLEDGSASVSGFNLANPAGTLLTATIVAGSTVTLRPGSGVRILEGDGVDDERLVIRGTAEQIGAALDGLTYKPTPDADGEGTLTISITDGSTTVRTVMRLEIIAQRDPPQANDDALTRTEDAVLAVGNVLANDTDPDRTPRPDVLTVESARHTIDGTDAPLPLGQAVTLEGGGTVVVLPDGTYSFDPAGAYDFLASGETAREEVRITVSDGTGLTDTSVLTITITGTDSAPRVDAGVSVPFVEGAQAALALTDFARDPEGGPVTLTQARFDGQPVAVDTDVTLATGEVLRVEADGGVFLSPAGGEGSLRAGEVLTRSLAFTVTDAAGNETEGSIDLTVTGVNEAPSVRGDGRVEVAEGATVALTLADLDAADPDSPDATRSYVLDTPAAQGTLVLDAGGRAETEVTTFTQTQLAAGRVAFRHDGAEPVENVLSLRVLDGDGGSSPALLRVAVTPVNDDPVPGGDLALSVAEGGFAPLTVSDLTAGDPDSEAGLRVYTVADVPDHVTLVRGAGTASEATVFTFTQAELEGGRIAVRSDGSEATSDTIDLIIADGDGGSATVTLAVAIEPVNDAPVVSGDLSVQVDEGAATALGTADIDAADPDSDPATRTYTILAPAPANGTLLLDAGTASSIAITSFTQAQLEAGRVSYAHSGNETVADDIAILVEDGDGGTDEATVSVVVVPVNDDPVATSSQALAVLEGDTAFLNADNLSVADVDSAGADRTFTLTGGAGQGRFIRVEGTAFVDVTSFTQAELDAGRIGYVHDGGEATTDSLSLTVTDGDGGSDDVIVAVTIAPVNDAPALVVDDSDTDFIEDGAPSAAMKRPVITDADDSQLEGATVAITQNFQTGDVLAFADTAKIAGSYDAGTGTLTLTGTATPAEYETALASVTFAHEGDDPAQNFRTLSVSVGDGDGTSDAQTVFQRVLAVNDAPTVSGDLTLSVDEGGLTPLTSADITATDPDSAVADRRYALDAGSPANGTLVRDAGTTSETVVTSFTEDELSAGRIAYRHDGSETTADTLALTVLDGDGGSVAATLAVTVTPVNEDPTVTGDGRIAADEGGSAVLTTTDVDATDPDSAPADRSYEVVVAPQAGALLLDEGEAGERTTTAFTQSELEAGRISYRHDGSEGSVDTLRLRVLDGDGGSAETDLAVDVAAVNDAPTPAGDRSVAVDEGAEVVLTTADIDATDPDSDPADRVYFLQRGSPGAGSLVRGAGTAGETAVTQFTQAELEAGDVSYRHDGSEGATDAIRLIIADGDAGTTPARIDVAVAPVNDPPSVGGDLSLALDEGASVTLTLDDLTVSDPDSAAAGRLYTVASGSPQNGVLELDDGGTPTPITSFTQAQLAAGQVRYRHDGSETSSDTVALDVSDGDGAAVPVTLSVAVTPRNDDPVASAAEDVSVAEGATVFLTGANLSVSDPDSAASDRAYSLTGGAAHGRFVRSNGETTTDVTAFTQAQLDDGEIAYIHDGSETLTDSLAIAVADGDGGTAAITLAVEVTPVNDAPRVVVDDSDDDFVEDGTPSPVFKRPSISDADDTELEGARIEISDNFQAGDTLLFTDTAKITGSFDPGTGVLLLTGTATLGEYEAALTAITFTHGTDDPAENFRTVKVTVFDGEAQSDAGSAFEQVVAVNDAPTAGGDLAIAVGEGGTTALTLADLTATDPDSDPADRSYALNAGSAASGALLRDPGTGTETAITSFTQGELAAGRIAYRHDGSETASDTIALTIDDGEGATVGVTVAVSVSGDNDDPVVIGDGEIATLEGAQVVVTSDDIDATDTDSPASARTYTLQAGSAANGELRLDDGSGGVPVTSFTQAQLEAGQVSYSHDGSETVTDTIALTVTDGDGGSASASLVVTVTPVNDPPTVSGDLAIETDEGAAVALTTTDVDATDPDSPDTARTYALAAGSPANGSLWLDLGSASAAKVTGFTQAQLDGGRIFYRHDGSETTSDTIVLTVDDGDGGTTVVTVAATVTPVNDPPVVTGDLALVVNEGGTVAITSADVDAIDPDSADAARTYALEPTSADHGALVLDAGAAGETIVTSFTQAQLDDGRISYRHDGSETVGDTIELTVSDGDGDKATANLSVSVNPVNDPPIATSASDVAVNEGAAVALGAANLSVIDPDSAPADRSFTVTTGPANGRFVRDTGSGLVDVTSFTQAQLDGGTIGYVHDGSETTTDQIVITVNDGDTGSDSVTVGVNVTPVNDAPTVTGDLATQVDEGGTVAIGAASLAATDPDSSPADRVYTVLNVPSHGRLLRNDVTELTSGATFSQQELAAGSVSYEHTGATDADDAFSLELADGDGATVDVIFSVTVNKGNDAPSIAPITTSGDVDYLIDIAGSTAFQLRVVENAGDGGAGMTGWTSGNRFPSKVVEAVDLDLDGDLDLYAVDTNGTGQGAIFRNDGTGQFTQESVRNVLDGASSATFADLDGDGFQDAVLTYADGSSPRVVLNGPDARLDGATSLLPAGSNAVGTAVADFDRDGNLDIVVAVPVGGSRVLLGDGAGGFTDSGQSLGQAATTGVAVADLNDDGHVDIYLADLAASDEVYLNDGNGVFTATGQTLTSGGTSQVQLGDLDDPGPGGDIDATLIDASNGELVIVRNDGTGTFDVPPEMLASGSPGMVHLADVDGDGDLDFVYSTSAAAPSSSVATNAGDGTSSGTIGLGAGTVMAVGDFDNDSDILVDARDAAGAYAFSASDFRYQDPNGDPMAHVTVRTLPASGALLLNGVAVAVGQQVAAADIPNLVFQAGFGNSGGSFDYSVSDGELESVARTMRVDFQENFVFDLADIAADQVPGLDATRLRGSNIPGQLQPRMGTSVASTGDRTGDGIDDFLLGAPNGQGEQTSPGNITGSAHEIDSGSLAHGTQTVFVDNRTTGNQNELFGQIAGGRAGDEVAGPGDVNNDGVPDIAVGAPTASLGNTNSGSVYVSVDPNLAYIQNEFPLGDLGVAGVAEGLRIDHTVANARFGTSIAQAGDFNGDGRDDLLIGAPGALSSQRGEAWLVYGGTNLDKGSSFTAQFDTDDIVAVPTSAQLRGWRGVGEAAGDALGYSVASAGDVDGDGFDDMLVSAPAYDNGVDNAGSVYLIFGGQTVTGTGDFGRDVAMGRVGGDIDGVEFRGVGANAFTGAMVSGLGDVTGDGIDDFGIVASGLDTAYIIAGGQSFGAVEFLTNVGTTIDGFRIEGADIHSISDGGDFDRDGINDFAVSGHVEVDEAVFERHTHLVFGGSVTGAVVETADLADGQQGLTFTNPANGPGSRADMTLASDVDNDGYDDFIIGSPGIQHNGANSGGAFIVYGDNVRGGTRVDGTASADTLAAVENSSVFGGDGNDMLKTNSAQTLLDGGRGEDLLIMTGDDTNQQFDGGDGQDTLRFEIAGNIDLSALSGSLKSIERLDVANGADNALTISVADIFAMSGSYNDDGTVFDALGVTNSLLVDADASSPDGQSGDAVFLAFDGQFGGSWGAVGGATANEGGYDFYQYVHFGTGEVLASLGVDENTDVFITS